MGGSNQFPDLLTVLINIGNVIPPIIYMLQYIAALIGAYLITSGLVELYCTSNDNAQKYIAGGQRFSVVSALVKFLTGSIFAAMGTLEWMGIMSRTVTGDYANSRFISYCTGSGSCGGSTLQEQMRFGVQATMGIMQIIGFVAMCKGIMMANKIQSGQSNVSLGTAITWMIGGVAAWNFEWVASVINNTIGFNLINLFKF